MVEKSKKNHEKIPTLLRHFCGQNFFADKYFADKIFCEFLRFFFWVLQKSISIFYLSSSIIHSRFVVIQD
ncbi:unnamed protein product [Meloidogyne enterolobii]|uniref:Uncharacterized protein n=1 Tax=Meloidogyne enterolobii TaxID=390850 RepID=A0ACB1AR78_MELEN